MEECCPIPGCGRPLYQRRAYCGSHFMKAYRYGDPLWTPPARYDDKTGKRYGRLTVIARTADGHWICQCDCGNRITTRAGCLNKGSTASCGQHRHADQIGYAGAHDRVEAVKGKASSHECVDCDKPAREWSYNHQDPEQRDGSYGPFSMDPGYYEPRCTRCHRIFDEHPWMHQAS